jgi:hypothetical protein
MERIRAWFVVALLVLAATPALLAQLPTAAILGVVKDTSGAVVPGATLTARNTETGQTRTAVSAADGSYRFAALPVGAYEIRVEHAGFQEAVRSGLTLTVGQEAVVNFSLAVGAVTSTVEVTAEAPLVNTTSGSLGSLVSEQSVADLPLNGRNYIDLTFLQPGISKNQNMTSGGTFVGSWFSSNGAPLRSNTYMLDGAVMGNFLGGSASSIANTTLGIEGIREWRVVTNTFSAEYGLTMGSQMAIVTKSGTNSFHGSVFEYLRNSALDARSFANQTQIGPQSPLRRNNFGVSVGGPVKKERVFFFGTYEGLRERRGISQIANVIPDECRQEPLATGCRSDGQTTIAGVVKPVIALIPRPNLPSTTPGNPPDRFGYTFTQPTTEDYGQGRIDMTISASDTLFGRYTHDETRQVKPLLFPGFVTDRFSKNQYITVSESHVFGASLVNTFRFSFSNTKIQLTSPTDLVGPEFIEGKGIGVWNFAIGEFGVRFSTPLNQNQKLYTWSDDLFYTRGAHSLKFGTLINHYDPFSTLGAGSTGQAIFGPISNFLAGTPVVSVARAPDSILDSEYHYNTLGFYVQDDVRVRSNFTLNLGLRYEFFTNVYEINGHGGAVRDPLHDAFPTCADPACLQGADDPEKLFENPSLHNFSPRVGFAWDVRGNGKTAVRAGAAILYDVATFNTAILSLPWPYSSIVRVPGGPLTLPLQFPPADSPNAKGGATGVDFHVKQPYSTQYNLSVEQELPWNLAMTASYVGSRGIHIYRRVDPNPAVPAGTPGVDTSGNPVCIDTGTPPNPVTGPKCWTGHESRLNPAWSYGNQLTGQSQSWYNAFEFQLRRRMSRGLQFQTSYTFSKSIDLGQGIIDAENTTSHFLAADEFNRQYDRGVSQFDLTHNFAFNAIYRLPDLSASGRGLGKLLNGWWLSGIVRAISGFPFTPALGGNRSLSQVGNSEIGLDRPDLVPGVDVGSLTSGVSRGCNEVAAGTPVGTPDLWFDPCAFTDPALGFLGNAGRNILRGPGLTNVDFTVAKDTALGFLGEAGRLEFRAEFFNILNHPNFATPEIGLADSPREALVFGGSTKAASETRLTTVGNLNGRTATGSREIQLSLKLLF